MDEILFIIVMIAGLGFSLYKSLKDTPKPNWKTVKQNLFQSSH
ncbi:hypothetical protein [Guptibacillus hwajinpoensis]|nr:hypothetical protein [Pseudalkalibacillus hwajinpoensis]